MSDYEEVRRRQRVREIVNEVSLKRASGESSSDDELIKSHPDLLPELANELRSLRIVESAEEDSKSSDEDLALAEDLSRTTPHPVDGDSSRLADIATAEAAIPKTIGRFRIERLLGQGGFGRVYLAHDDQLQRSVAIKVAHRKIIPGTGVANEHLAEARTLAGLDHPNIVPVYELGSAVENPCFIVSKYIEGMSLRERMRAGGVSCQSAVDLVMAVAKALDYAHSKRIIHRDVKPANILLDKAGNPYVADFGLALTERGFGKGSGVMGTAAYLSPEQARGEGHLVDGRSDVFSLGIVFFELLTGQQPFSGSDTREIARHVAEVDVRPPRQLDGNIPKELERICLKALAKRVSDRYATCGDFGEDLSHWRDPVSAKEQTPVPAPDSRAASPVSVVPKGLRCFDQHDADFFLSLVPGPRDRHGLPDSIREWKVWAESKTPDDTQRVGVIYGPSGCGKSSLVRAGLVPLLDDSVMPIVVEASQQQTETRLLTYLRAKLPGTSEAMGLAETLAEIRRGRELPSGRKLLIVIEQFEQWLHGQGDYEATELVRALRQCDGVRIQCLLLVRDDFFLGLSRFMSVLDIPLIQGHNMTLIDLFDQAHAHKVLAAFGRAYGRIPNSLDEMRPDQIQFLSRSIESLASHGKIFPVRLALFTEMVKARPWTTSTVNELGGIEGIGAAFLEESFSGEHAPASHRIHDTAARAVLESLLPEPGEQVKGRRRSTQALMKAAEYDADRFADLLRILDSEMRLITPTESSDPTSPDQEYYQLSHDYLVHSVREWTLRKQKETSQGRLHLELADRAALWSPKRQRRFLPTWWEWLEFRFLLPKRRCTEEERTFLQAASHHYKIRTAAVVCAFMVIAAASLFGLRLQRARALQEQLLTAELSNVPEVIERLGPLRSHVVDSLRETAETSEDHQRKLVATVALTKWGVKFDGDIYDLALESDPTEMLLINEHVAQLTPEASNWLWALLKDNQADHKHRFCAAQLLANHESEQRDQWKPHTAFVEEELVNGVIVDPQQFSSLTRLLQPIVPQLLGPLSTGLAQLEQTVQATTRLNLLVHLTRHEPKKLLALCVGASKWQLPLVLPALSNAMEQEPSLVEDLLQIISETPTADQSPEVREAMSRCAANSAAILSARGRAGDVWHLLQNGPLPATQALLIHRFHALGAPIEPLTQRLDRETDAGIRAALLLAMGEYEPPDNWTMSSLFERIRSLYRNDPDPGVQGAAEWLLRRWQPSAVDEQLAVNDLKPPTSAKWRVNSEGHTLIQLDGRNHSPIGRSFELATFEVTNAQFTKYDPAGGPRHMDLTKAPLDGPVGIIQWHEAVNYCNWLSDREGLPHCYDTTVDPVASRLGAAGYRLPTSAEWEFACRAGSTTVRYFGDSTELMTNYAWCYENAIDRPRPCGLLKPNQYGIFDLYGNAMEWCDDAKLKQRVVRGRARSEEFLLRSDWHGASTPTTQQNSYGFRIARTVPVE